MNKQGEGEIIQFLINNKLGQSKIVNSTLQLQDQCECIKVIANKAKAAKQRNDSSLFVDHEFSISVGDINSLKKEFNENIILKRICRLFPKKHKPSLFANPQIKNNLARKSSIPHFIYEISMFDSSAFKKVIVNKEISEDGKYEILVHKDGKYLLEVIDDIVPVFERNEEPIWGSCLQEPWQIILAKTWAKIKQGYSNLKVSNSFQFLQCFASANWKYFNIKQEGRHFLSYYKDKISQNSKILLKAKDSQRIEESGLASGRVSYELLAIQSDKNENPILIIRTGFQNAWTGKQSIFDKQLVITDKIKEKFKLRYTLMLNSKDFLNIFSKAYVTHTTIDLPIYRNFHQFTNPVNLKKARYFQISFQSEGFFNFSIHQPQQNMFHVANDSPIMKLVVISNEEAESFISFPSLKILLSRKINSEQIQPPQNIQLSKIGSIIRDSRKKFDDKYNEIDYDLYDMEHQIGVNKENAHFLKVVPGTYVLRIKAEATSFKSNYVITYTTRQFSCFKEIFMAKQDSSNFLSHNMISISDSVPHQSISKQKYESFSMGDLTDNLGYAFFVMKVNKKCPYKVAVETDPQLLASQGYKLKREWKNLNFKFVITLCSGESKAIIFKRIQNRKSYIWPSQAFKVFLLKD